MKPQLIILIIFTVVFIAACRKKPLATLHFMQTDTIQQTDTIGFHHFSEGEPQYVSSRLMDSIMNHLSDKDNFLFVDLYPVIDTLPPISDDRFILAEKLDSLGFTWTDGGQGNWERGPRYRYRKYENDSLDCYIYKAYQTHEMNPEDSCYNMVVYEQIESIRNANR